MFDMADRSTCERKKILEKMKNIYDDLFFITKFSTSFFNIKIKIFQIF